MRKIFVLLSVLSFCLSNYAQSVKVISLDLVNKILFMTIIY